MCRTFALDTFWYDVILRDGAGQFIKELSYVRCRAEFHHS